MSQGSILASCLFMCYIDDIAQGINATRVFADDTVICIAIENDRDTTLLLKDFDLLLQWERKWMIEFYPAKGEVFSITEMKTSMQFYHFLHGQWSRQWFKYYKQ